MFQPKLRSLIASTALLSALISFPDRALGSGPRQPAERKGHPAAVSRVAGPLWDLLVQWLCKRDAGVTIDPEGVQSKPPQEGGTVTLTAPSGVFPGGAS